MLTVLMQFMSDWGMLLLWFLVFLAILYLVWERKASRALALGAVVVFGSGFSSFLKLLFQRPRPSLSPLVIESSYSFPSGHAMNSLIIYLCLVFYVILKIKNRKLKYFLMLTNGVFVCLIGMSRIYLGVHFASDVLVGYTIAFIWFGLTALFVRRFGLR